MVPTFPVLLIEEPGLDKTKSIHAHVGQGKWPLPVGGFLAGRT